jgi:hypothetical protein
MQNERTEITRLQSGVGSNDSIPRADSAIALSDMATLAREVEAARQDRDSNA